MKTDFRLTTVAVTVMALVLTGCSKEQVAQTLTPSVYAQNANFTYQDYTDEAFNELKGAKAFSVFVHSKTCGTCAKKDKQIINEVDQFTVGTILKMEYADAPQDFIKTYGINKYDTFVTFDAAGNHTTTKGAKVDAVRTDIGNQALSATTPEANILARNENFVYQDFDTNQYNSLKGSEAFAVFFHSKTCGTCAKKDKQIIDEVAQFKNGTILKLEYSEAPTELLKELGVTKYDTFVTFDPSGNPTAQKGATVQEIRNTL